MCKKKSLLQIVIAFLLIAFTISCQHNIPISCDLVNFKVTATKTDATQNLSNGTITATAAGGSGFMYSINGAAFTSSGVFTGLAPFSVNKIVGKNAQGCKDSVEVTIGTNDPCQGVVINVTATKVDPTINQSNGTITATATGGTGFTYSLNGGTFQASGSFTNLAVGNYSISAKSALGCIGATSVTLGSTDPCAGITVLVTTTQTQPTTGNSNGSITALATGGSSFTYSLNNGTYQASGVFSNLAAGNYTIIAKNANGCLGSTTVALGATNPCAGVNVIVTTTQVNPSTGAANGSITASATGGTGFTYSLNNGTFQAASLFSNLGIGNYTITAKNSNSCLGTKLVTLVASNPCTNVNIVINQTIVQTTPCGTTTNNGSITVTATGSTGFTYNINGGVYQTSNAFLNLNAGTYLLGVKDVNGCTNTKSVAVGVVPQGPTFAAVRQLITNRCSGSGCHMGGANAAGYNFDADCSIVNKWSQINNTCVLYTAGWVKMPKSPQALFTAAEKATLTSWINAGHRYTD